MDSSAVDGALVGESGEMSHDRLALVGVEGRHARDFDVALMPRHLPDPQPFGPGDLTLAVIGPGGDVLAAWPEDMRGCGGGDGASLTLGGPSPRCGDVTAAQRP